MFASKDIFLKSSGGGGYQISRSVRLRSSASAYLSETFGTPTNNKIWTYSGWVKRSNIGSNGQLFAHYTSDTQNNYFQFSGDVLRFSFDNGTVYAIATSAVFRDPSAWYHVVIAVDTTQATAANRTKLYVNGVEQTVTGSYVPQNTNTYLNGSGRGVTIGRRSAAADQYLDGYLTEINFIDGQALTPSSFGETNAVTGVWQPKQYTGTYGNNGFYLNFSNNSTAAALGTDFSGNGNTWTVNNISVTAGVTYDSMLDVPTPYADGGNGRGNYCVLNTVSRSISTNAPTPTSGNLEYATPAGVNTTGWPFVLGSIGITNGKWYFEVDITGLEADSVVAFGFAQTTIVNDSDNTDQLDKIIGAIIRNDSASTGLRSAVLGTYVTRDGTDATNAVYQIAIDNDSGKLWIGKANTWYASGNPSAGTGEVGTFTSQSLIPLAMLQKSNTTGDSNLRYNFGQRPFSYTPPTGFVALNTQNLPTPTISNGASYMAATTYTGTGSALTIANTVGSASFQPDLVWVKGRSGATDHAWYDAVRGVQKQLESNTTTAETTETTGLTAFGSTGFTVGALAQMNTNTATYVAWQWNAGGSNATNTSGTINSTVRANTTSGFSIVTYTGTGSNATVGHGLGVAPKFFMVKTRTGGIENWYGQHASLTSGTYYVMLNSTAAETNDSTRFTAFPTSTVLNLGANSAANGSGYTYVAYCFAPVAGYSAFGKYTGNGSADGPFVYLGFRPRYLLIKSSVVAGGTWVVFDSARSTYNVTGEKLAPNTADSENSGATGIAGGVDFLSNGFKIRLSWGDINTSNTLIYAAFAENPFKLSLAR